MHRPSNEQKHHQSTPWIPYALAEVEPPTHLHLYHKKSLSKAEMSLEITTSGKCAAISVVRHGGLALAKLASILLHQPLPHNTGDGLSSHPKKRFTDQNLETLRTSLEIPDCHRRDHGHDTGTLPRSGVSANTWQIGSVAPSYIGPEQSFAALAVSEPHWTPDYDYTNAYPAIFRQWNLFNIPRDDGTTFVLWC